MFDKRLVVFSVASIVASFVVLMAVIPLIEKDNKKRGVIIQGIFRIPLSLFASPTAVSSFSKAQQMEATTSWQGRLLGLTPACVY